MSSIQDLISSLKTAFRDASFSRIENELRSREEIFKHEIEVQQNEIERQKKEIERQRKEIQELEEQLQYVRLDKVRIEEHFQKKLENLQPRIVGAEKEIENLKSFKASMENGGKQVKIEKNVINLEEISRPKGIGKPSSENTLEILDSDEDWSRGKTKDMKITSAMPKQGLLRKELKCQMDDSDSGGSTSSDDSDEDIIPKSWFRPIFKTIASANKDKRKWNCEAELKAAFEEDGKLCMKAVCALSRQQIICGKKFPDSSTSDYLGFDRLYAQRGMLLSNFLTAGDPEGKLKTSIADLNASDAKGLDDCRRIAIAHVNQLFKISQQNEESSIL